MSKTIYRGTFVHTPDPRTLTIFTGSVYVSNGEITDISKHDLNQADPLPSSDWTSANLITAHATKHEFFFPGFIDTHTHAPQFPNTGLGGSETLLTWLEKYTFPVESTFSSVPRAKHIYTHVVARLLAQGTTCAAYYATLHVDATNELARVCYDLGQRALVGRVCMDSAEHCPEFYRDASVEDAMRGTKACLDFVRSLDPDARLLRSCVTPRFAPSCSPQALERLGDLAREEDLPVQTHVSENVDEIELVGRLFPQCGSYTGVYDRYGLLGGKTVLAHCVHLQDEEIALIEKRDAGVAHCPLSNVCLSSGNANVRKLLDAGLKVGLGTDVSGGYNPSLLAQARVAEMVSRQVAMSTGVERSRLAPAECLFLATRGGAKVLGIEDKVGAFEVGKSWDAQLIRLDAVAEDDGVDGGSVCLFGSESWEEKVQKWFFCGDDRNTVLVWVGGRLVHQRKSG
ncbi:guanine deaminase [Piedraia hortae CBS 480.64]|uniref:Guanine deaminase n=1 Tax=Piedraia hortae CBS 480.64 TaxID=1314780 RepID=A0A6A7C000_9PEZI|nr:guanine deaminase [Piedraia hortae CBS 480.64]